MFLSRFPFPPLHDCQETFEYLSTEAIGPSPSPQKYLLKAIQGVGVQEWPEIFHTLTSIRRLSLHHSALLVNSR